MSQLVSVSEPSVQRALARRKSLHHSEPGNKAVLTVGPSQKQMGQLQENTLAISALRLGEAGGSQATTSLGQVMAFLIELADQDATSCPVNE